MFVPKVVGENTETKKKMLNLFQFSTLKKKRDNHVSLFQMQMYKLLFFYATG